MKSLTTTKKTLTDGRAIGCSGKLTAYGGLSSHRGPFIHDLLHLSSEFEIRLIQRRKIRVVLSSRRSGSHEMRGWRMDSAR